MLESPFNNVANLFYRTPPVAASAIVKNSPENFSGGGLLDLSF